MPSIRANLSTSAFPQTRKQLIKELKFRDQKQHGHLGWDNAYYEMKADLILAERRVPTKQAEARARRRVDPAAHDTDIVFVDPGITRRSSRPPSYELPIPPPRYRSPPSYRQTRSSPKRSSKRRQRLWYST